MKRILALVLVLLTFSGILLDAVSHASAASVTYYQASKTDVPIWSQTSSSSTKIKTIMTIGTVLKVKGSTTNSAGNLWYQLSDGYWVFSGNVVSQKHSYTINSNVTLYAVWAKNVAISGSSAPLPPAAGRTPPFPATIHLPFP